MGGWSKQFAQWANRPAAQVLSALIFLVFLIISLTLGQWMNAMVWVAFLVGSGLNYLVSLIPPSRPLARRLASIAAGLCFVVAVLLVLYTLFAGRS